MLKGIIAPNLTFFHEDGSVDLEKCREHMDWMLGKGVNGLFVTGTYGSGYLMSLEERLQVFRIAGEVAGGHENAFVIAHTGCPDTASSVFLAREAERMGLDAVSAIAPYNYKYTEEELLHFYGTLAESCSLPVFAYNNPEITGKPITPAMLRKLKAAGIAGIKDSAIDLKLAGTVYNENGLGGESFQYITGTTTGWLVLNKIGVDTMIAGMNNYAPEVVAALYRLSRSDEKKAMEAYRISTELDRVVKVGNSLMSCHLALIARGFDSGYLRRPLSLNREAYTGKIGEMKTAIEEALAKLSTL